MDSTIIIAWIATVMLIYLLLWPLKAESPDLRASNNVIKSNNLSPKERKQMKKTRSIAALLILLAGTFAVAGQTETIKVGKKGDIMLSKEATVGDVTLKPGHYQIQHRVVGTDHMIHFTELKGMHSNPYYSTGPTGTAHPGEIKCRLEPMATKASQTAVYTEEEGGLRRITKIEIKGENVAHVF